jgi:hypothetical protein
VKPRITRLPFWFYQLRLLLEVQPLLKMKQWLHPWLFSAYPVLALFALNIDQIRSTAMMRSLLVTIAESPKFVYAHFVAPHLPIVFGATGEAVTIPEDTDMATYEAAYRGEVIYLNQRILEIVREIIAVSANPPVIIIQGDHGDNKSESDYRMRILNAYYLPGVDRKKLYPSITPVNSFRLVFNEYFGGNYELLPDKSYFSDLQDPLNYTEILNTCVREGE